MSECTILALYAFVPLQRLPQLKLKVEKICNKNCVIGTLLLASEGLNGTLAGCAEGIDAVESFLAQCLPDSARLEAKRATAAKPPFGRLRVRIKSEIVSMGVSGIDPTQRVGTYVEPEQWNALLEDPEVLTIDTRNAYEARIGSFHGAINPETESFRDFPGWAREHLDPRQHKRVAMFCTGGIRCEKATALLLEQGFKQVYHLHGGVLRYLEQVSPPRSAWWGECFVFDRRVAVDHALRPGSHTLCYGCLEPLSAEDLRHPDYEPSVCCHRCAARTDPQTRERRRERARQVELADARGDRHLHVGPLPEDL